MSWLARLHGGSGGWGGCQGCSFIHSSCFTKGLALNLTALVSPFSSRFKVFADYEEYIKCQDKVSELYKVRDHGPGAGRALFDSGWDEREWGQPAGRVNLETPFLSSEPKRVDTDGDQEHSHLWQVFQ